MIYHAAKLRLVSAFILLVIFILPTYAQKLENNISLAHHSNVECTASVNGISTKGLVAESSGTPKATGGVCHVTPDEPVEIILTAPTDPATISIEGLAGDSIATFYDQNNQVVGTYTGNNYNGESVYSGELIGLNVSRISITSIETLLVKNGSFEAIDPVGDDNIAITTNNLAIIPGWELVSGSLDWFGTGVEAAEGTRSVDVSGSGIGTIHQTIETEVGKAYVLRFAMSGDPAGGLPEKMMTTTIGDVSETFTYILSSENSTQNMLWQYHSIAFTATEPTTDLSFTSLVEGWYGPTIDNVSIREGQVCSPATDGIFEVNFVNNTDEEVTYHWMAFDCSEGGGPVLAPGASELGQTYPGHIYRIRGADGRIIGQYVASPNNPTSVVGDA